MAINACLLLGADGALFGEALPRFQAGPFLPAFLRALQPRVAAGALPHVAPEAMQALAEHCVAAGRPEDVERCVLRMDVLSLDLNQVRGGTSSET